MATGRFSDHRVHLWLAELDQLWIALHFDNPDMAGAYASEVFGGSYTRLSTGMTVPSSRGIYTVANLLFTGLPAVTITHVAGWDAQYNGNMEFSVQLDSPVNVAAGKAYSLPAGLLAASFA